jgi:hypothetical protein
MFRFSTSYRMYCYARPHVLSNKPIQVELQPVFKPDTFAGPTSALKERERDERDDKIARLKSKVGEITMDNELLYAKIAAMEGKRPLARRRPRR